MTPHSEQVPAKRISDILHTPFFGGLSIFFLTVFAYLPAINGGFIWDDDGFLTQNPLIKAGDGLFRFWFTTEAPDYFPLVSSSLWVEWRIWGEVARGYHITNVLLHALSSVLLWKLFEKLKVPGAWVCGVIYALHPVHVESVAWITERKNTLSMPFYLAALIAYLNFEMSEKKRFFAAALLLFFFALTAKPMVVMLPVVLLLFCWWQRGRVSLQDFKRTLPFFFLSLVFGLLTVWFQYTNAIGNDSVGYSSLLSKFAGSGRALFFYFYKALLPLNLSFIYPRWDIDTSLFINYSFSLLLLATVPILFVTRGSMVGRPLFFAFSYFLFTLFPILGFLDIYFMRYSFVADHWQYAATPGLIGLFVGCGFKVYQRQPEKVQKLAAFTSAFPLIFFFLLTWKKGEIYKDTETLWRATIEKNPAAFLAHNDLGNILKNRGESAQAMAHYLEAIKFNPKFVETHNNIGTLLEQMGRPEEALSYFYKALEINPKSEIILNSLGNTLSRMGRFDEAESSFTQALEVQKEFVPTYINLGYLFFLRQDYEKSIVIYKKGLQFAPEHPMLHLNIGASMAKEGKLDEAIRYYYLALEKKPGYKQAHRNLGIALNRKGNFEKARYHFSKANSALFQTK